MWETDIPTNMCKEVCPTFLKVGHNIFLVQKFDLEVEQSSRSPRGTNRKGLSQGSYMPNINALSLILHKIRAMLKFLWETDRLTDRQTDGRTNEFLCPLLSRKAGDKKYDTADHNWWLLSLCAFYARHFL